MSSRCADRRAQRGVALITVLLVFVLATMMATHMLRSSYLAMHRTGNLIDTTQARYYAYGAEELGRLMLAAQPAGSPGAERIDHLGQEWAREGLSFEIDEGVLELEISDLAGRFNLNSLIDASGQRDPAALARFARLLSALRLDQALAERVADWIDKDTRTTRGGEEESAYGARIPNLPFVETSELRSIPGIDAEAWELLEPEVAALPPGTRLNVNTAREFALVAYAENPSRADLERFMHARKLQPLRSAQDPQLASLFAQSVDALDVKSDFFLLSTHAEYRGRHVRMHTLVRRDERSGKLDVAGRSDAARL